MAQLPENLNMDSLFSKDDMNKIVELLGQNSVSLGGGNSKKKNQLTPQAKNFLLNQLAAHQKIEQVQKPFKDMNEEEKKAYRAELKSRLHNKQTAFKQQRMNQTVLQKSLDAKIKKTTEKMKAGDEKIVTEPEDKVDETGQTEQTNETNETNIQEQASIENLDDFLN
jgi:hypothetical protein